VWEGDSPEEALAAMHRSAGYDVEVVENESGDQWLRYPDHHDEMACRQVEDWHITRAVVEEGQRLYAYEIGRS
tara:strand:+ start:419 stop:637 length:219 start_codon:yes stop_codon:yes gene_type:complete